MFEYLMFTEKAEIGGAEEIRIEVCDGMLHYRYIRPEGTIEGTYSGNAADFIETLEDMDVDMWEPNYGDLEDRGGFTWSLTYKEIGKRSMHFSGSNAYPEGYEAFTDLLFSVYCGE